MVSKTLQKTFRINQVSKATTKRREVRLSVKLKKSFMEIQVTFFSLKLNSKTTLSTQWITESTWSATTQMLPDKFLKKLTWDRASLTLRELSSFRFPWKSRRTPFQTVWATLSSTRQILNSETGKIEYLVKKSHSNSKLSKKLMKSNSIQKWWKSLKVRRILLKNSFLKIPSKLWKKPHTMLPRQFWFLKLRKSRLKKFLKINDSSLILKIQKRGYCCFFFERFQFYLIFEKLIIIFTCDKLPSKKLKCIILELIHLSLKSILKNLKNIL